jgi:putative membrane protein
MRQTISRRVAPFRPADPEGGSRLTKYVGNAVTFVLAAGLVYLIGAALLTSWPMLSAMVSAASMGNALLWMFVPLLLLGGLLIAVAWAAARLFAEGGGEKPDPAEEILRGRFARGEIDAEEYDKTLEALRSQREEV